MRTTTRTSSLLRLTSGLVALVGSCVLATAGQVVRDGTVGPAGALPGPGFVIPDTDGATRGRNLFHSFSQFNLDAGDSATFTGPEAIKNIITRVTGGNPSSIDGAIDTTAMPNANFFFINPFGVIFGPHATLNVGGSVAITTADYVKLADGGRFDARNPANDILTAAPVSAFGFLGPTAAPISLESVPVDFDDPPFLAFLPDGKSFWLVGGDIIQNGYFIVAFGGQFAYVSVASAGELAVDVENPRFEVDTAPFATLGDVTLTGGAALYVSGAPAGSVSVDGNRILFDNASISTDNEGEAAGGDIRLTARSGIELNGGSIGGLVTGDGDAGNITITAPSLLMRGANLAMSSIGNGDSGDIFITVNEFTLLDGGGIGIGNFGGGAGGSLVILADHVRIQGDPVAGSAPTLGAQVVSDSPAGSIRIEANTVELLTGGQIDSSSSGGTAPGGDIFIKAQLLVLDDQNGKVGLTKISSQSLFGGAAGGGNIVLEVGQLQVLNGAQITTTTETAGSAGTINIHAADVTLTGGAIKSAATVDGAAGSIALDVTGSVQLNQSEISVSAAQAAGGDITITAGNEIQLSDSSLSAQANLDGGNITLTAPNTVYLLNSQIKAESTTGNGGNITIDPTFVVLNNSSLIANAITGNGGNITIDSTYFLASASLIDASSEFGLQGSIRITALNFDVTGNLLTLPGNPLDAESRLRPHCAIRLPQGASSFTVTGRSQLPAEPDGLLPAFP